ncbi:MAG: SUF system NifU family Fe-S cluster assembly protein [Bacilli bacterium]|jgi:SUF system NifU family Fe-S assembly protein|nr:SUF system NifU family Fe-S cluster assembly protein [Bacilli bacterium]MDY0209656.1 SUF system NifU family Fe-S cluster assembly protein [Bacilli bacterium]
MNNIENLYRQVIMDHYKNPRNKGLKGYPHVHIKNPSCGDDITVEARIENGVIKEINHQGTGCSICCSSASVLSEVLKGKTVKEANALIQKYMQMIKGEPITDEEELEEALVYEGVSKFPARIKCATVAWKALEKVINGDADEE